MTTPPHRKLALAFHPDKNKAPGAGEAFKVTQIFSQENMPDTIRDLFCDRNCQNIYLIDLKH